ncbi:hypothetical protein Q3G72_021289 [Acer saccharum]|nr:hypothetical protein Q3G72_021289 [Acer saccharum]
MQIGIRSNESCRYFGLTFSRAETFQTEPISQIRSFIGIQRSKPGRTNRPSTDDNLRQLPDQNKVPHTAALSDILEHFSGSEAEAVTDMLTSLEGEFMIFKENNLYRLL